MKCQSCPLIDSDQPCPGEGHRRLCELVDGPRGEAYRRMILGHKPPDPEPLPRLQRMPAQLAYSPDDCRPREPIVPRARPADLDLELVVSKYREDVAWVNDSPIPVTLYDKCPSSGNCSYNSGVVVRHLENVGREAHTMLHHIVHNYNHLAGVSYFVQGSTHSGEELFGRMAAAPADRVSSLTLHYMDNFPDDDIKALDRVEFAGSYEVRYGRADRHGNRTAAENRAWLDGVWRHWFECDQPEDWYFAYAAELAVPRAAILGRPHEFWLDALHQVSLADHDHEKWDASPANAWAWESIWMYALGDPVKYPVRMPKPPETPKKTKKVSLAEAKAQGMTPPKSGCGCKGAK